MGIPYDLPALHSTTNQLETMKLNISNYELYKLHEKKISEYMSGNSHPGTTQNFET